MTAHLDSTHGTSMGGTPVSNTDLARIAAEEKLHADHRRSAVRVVAAGSRDAEDCRTLLAMLGIGNDVVVAARAQLPSPPKPSRKGRAAA